MTACEMVPIPWSGIIHFNLANVRSESVAGSSVDTCWASVQVAR